MAQEELPKQQAQPTAEETHESDQEILERLRKSAQPVFVGVTIALVAFIAYSAYKWYRQDKLERASALYAAASSPMQWQQVVNEYPGTPAAPLALLSIASTHYHDAKYDEAEAAYQQFLTNHSGHVMQRSVEVALAYCQEAKGRYMESAQSFESFAKAQPDHYLFPMAVFGQARSLEQAGQFDEARIVYEDFIAAHSESEWLEEAESSLKYLDMKARAREKGIPYPPPIAEMAPPPQAFQPPPLIAAPPATPATGTTEIEIPVTTPEAVPVPVPVPVPEVEVIPAAPAPEPVAEATPVVPEPAPVPTPEEKPAP